MIQFGHREVFGVRFGWEASLSTRRSLSKSLWGVRQVHFRQFRGKARVFGGDLVKRAQWHKNGWFWSAGRRGAGLLPFSSDRKRCVTKVEDLFFLIFCSFFDLLSDLWCFFSLSDLYFQRERRQCWLSDQSMKRYWVGQRLVLLAPTRALYVLLGNCWSTAGRRKGIKNETQLLVATRE